MPGKLLSLRRAIVDVAQFHANAARAKNVTMEEYTIVMDTIYDIIISMENQGFLTPFERQDLITSTTKTIRGEKG